VDDDARQRRFPASRSPVHSLSLQPIHAALPPKPPDPETRRCAEPPKGGQLTRFPCSENAACKERASEKKPRDGKANKRLPQMRRRRKQGPCLREGTPGCVEATQGVGSPAREPDPQRRGRPRRRPRASRPRLRVSAKKGRFGEGP
jgi:hypothetical protein